MAFCVYYQEFTTDNEYRIIQMFDWGERREVPKDYDEYLAWIADGHTAGKTSGSQFVTIVNGEPIYDEKGALEQERQNKLSQIEAAYYPQFQELSQAFTAAQIVGDTEAISANRTAWQDLLEDYNEEIANVS